ncbi:hypothetical protein [Myxococcus sp. CA040A]|uniref:hypothetical protein n=1 Tax=Myxococcus sp. CA040A TaxID=2741738 RepID=UPI00157BA88C|nr:hypothetical protein [Myxococcus sp. CA040A]NTX07055.1 hypothetical protein [Myxococcus sp. CA040A]
MRHLIALVLALLAARSNAAAPKPEAPPLFVNIPAVAENAWLTMDCTGTGSLQTVRCRFTQIRVHRKSPEEVAAAVAAAKAEFQSKPDEPNKLLEEVCSEWNIIGDGYLTGTEEWSAARQRTRALAIQRIAKMCGCPDDACRLDYFLTEVGDAAKACRIISTQFEATLKRVGKNKWINEPKPVGACNAVTAMVAEKAGDNSWTFTQTRLTVDTEIPLCVGMARNVNQPFVFKTDPNVDISLDCSTIRADIL